MKARTISFTARDAEHLYEWVRMYWVGDDRPYGGCYSCEHLGKRLKRFIGPSAARRIERAVRAYPNRSTK